MGRLVRAEPDRDLGAELHDNELRVRREGLSSPTPSGNGGFNWTAVGNQASGHSTRRVPTASGRAATDPAVEGQCSLNADPNADAEDPRVGGRHDEPRQRDRAVGGLG